MMFTHIFDTNFFIHTHVKDDEKISLEDWAESIRTRLDELAGMTDEQLRFELNHVGSEEI